ncbi:MAG: FAD-binding protein [Firmicutes bacterium]|nr:FAD-binding protein [Bacillota bacterium]
MYDVVIIGGGPAGIFAAYELGRTGKLRVLLLERGLNLEQRECPTRITEEGCLHCQPCSIMSGWGGAGAFSDGKLTLTADFGGWLEEYIGRPDVERLIDEADRIYLKFGATDRIYGENSQAVEELGRRADKAGLRLIPARIRHLGTENNVEILRRMRQHIEKTVEIRTLTPVDRILARSGAVTGVRLEDGQEIKARYVIAAPGRQGAEWFQRECAALGIRARNNLVDIGVRVEVPAAALEEVTREVYESKLIFYTPTFKDQIRTFCMNPGGEVVMENTDGVVTVNGHSYRDPARHTANTNFALLVRQEFTEPFNEPLTYGRSIARLANMLGHGVLVQRLGDLRRGRRSNPQRIREGGVTPTLVGATPGDLGLALPHRYVVDIVEMLTALDRFAPGVASDDTLLYGVEVKFYSARPQLSGELETSVRNLLATGDGAGVTRGLAQASASGLVAAQAVLRRERLVLVCN